MPVVNKPNSMALLPQPEPSTARHEGEGQGNRPHQRQPTSLQGLLRFAVEVTRAEDASIDPEFQPMDEEVGIRFIEIPELYFFFVEEAVFGKCS